MMIRVQTALAVSLVFWLVPDVAPAQLRVISSGGFRGAYLAVLPAFEKATGIAITTAAGASQGEGPSTIPAQLRRGTPADVVIMSKEGLEDLVREGRIVAGTQVDLAQSPLAVAVRTGARHPDISSVDALRQTLLRAKSVTHQGSTTGRYMTEIMFPRLGVAEEVGRKLSTVGVPAVARGDIEIALQPLSELVHAPGAEVVGNVPAEVQFVSVFSAAIVAGAERVQAARQLIAFLASGAADAAVKDNGMERVTKQSDGKTSQSCSVARLRCSAAPHLLAHSENGRNANRSSCPMAVSR
jgi:molybdate transport system substrate-binding protein